jgi:thiamine-phosphate pyrophosphorylase
MLRYAITDRARASMDESSRQQALLRQAQSLARDGVDFVQLREKDLEAGALASLAREVLAVLRSHAKAPKLLINSRADVAVATGADGVHLTSATGELTPADIRRLYASAGLPEPIISISCHTLSEIPSARDATLILFGPIFEKMVSANNAPQSTDALVSDGIGLNLLHLACTTAAPTPVLALGGITPENTSATLEAGAAGVAAIRMFLAPQPAFGSARNQGKDPLPLPH